MSKNDSSPSEKSSTENHEEESNLQPKHDDKSFLTAPDIKTIGKYMEKMSNKISDNIVLARYATFSAIGLLTVYGLSNVSVQFT